MLTWSIDELQVPSVPCGAREADRPVPKVFVLAVELLELVLSLGVSSGSSMRIVVHACGDARK